MDLEKNEKAGVLYIIILVFLFFCLSSKGGRHELPWALYGDFFLLFLVF